MEYMNKYHNEHLQREGYNRCNNYVSADSSFVSIMYSLKNELSANPYDIQSGFFDFT